MLVEYKEMHAEIINAFKMIIFLNLPVGWTRLVMHQGSEQTKNVIIT